MTKTEIIKSHIMLFYTRQFLSFLFILLGCIPEFHSETCPGDKIKCSDQETCCLAADGGFMCCPAPEAICCADGIHCCTQDSYCDTGQSECLPLTPANSTRDTSDSSDVIPDWFYTVDYCVIWRNPYKWVESTQCAKMFQQTGAWDICDGDDIGRDCFRNIRLEFTQPDGAPAWWVAVQVLADSFIWSTRFVLHVPGVAPGWLKKVQLCFYKNGEPYCAPANEWTPEFRFENHIFGAFGFLAPSID